MEFSQEEKDIVKEALYFLKDDLKIRINFPAVAGMAYFYEKKIKKINLLVRKLNAFEGDKKKFT